MLYDGLGRTTESRQYEGSGHYTAVQTQYDALGRAYKASNPFRPWNSETAVWTTSAFDALGRVTSVTSPDSAVVTSNYSGNTVTATDQVGKARKSVSDALGRLTSIYEDPSGSNYQTNYTYNVLNDLTQVSQGTQTRTFGYDSLKRLTSAANPESGTVTIDAYDNNGNVLVSTDARGVSTHVSYDELNRPTRRWYNSSNSTSSTTNNSPSLPSGVGATAEVAYFYDSTLPSGAPSFTRGASIGKLIAVTYGSNSTTGDYYGFDSVGREILKIQQTGSVNYQVSASYNVSGALTAETYPSGRTVTNTFDSAGRTQSVTGTLGDGTSRTYSTGISYSSLGGLSQEQFGMTTPVYNKLAYNNRGQLAEIRESTTGNDTSWNRGKIVNDYSLQCSGASCNGTDNNGNLQKQTVYVPNNDANTSSTSWYQQYSYDALNRLTQVHEYTGNTSLDWQQSYSYDQYGNRTINGNTSMTYPSAINSVQAAIDTSNNRLYATNDSNHTVVDYDAAGNQTKDYLTSNGTRTYDANNRMITATDSSNHTSTYTYDGEGQRIKRSINGTETWQVYGLGGELLAEYAANANANSPQKEYGYRNGQLLITADVPATFNGYFYRRTITVDHTKVPNTDQSNFPLLVSGTYSYLATTANSGNVQNSNGFDVIFASDLGCTTKLNHEVESYNAATGAVNYWVKVPTLSHTSDSVIYMCYGNSSVTTDQSNPTGVWDANYKGVWHLGNGSTLSGVDSTNQLNGTNHGATSVSGKVGGGAGFNGSQNISVGNNSLTSGITLEAWVYRTAANGFDIFADFGWNSTDGFVAMIGNTGTTHGFVKHAVQYVDSGVSSPANTWQHIVWTVDADKKPRLFVNGSLRFTSTDTQALVASTHGGSLGSRLDSSGNASQFFTGNVDEVRLSSTVRSADWIAAEYNNQNSPATFYSVSAATSSSGGTMANVRWLVSDQLGTPRMVFDQSGSLANVSRHDYLPFGEELTSSQGLRSASLGYAINDGTRQHFTSYERDSESGLDYAHARFYANMQGRFTSPDPLMTSARPIDPQTWNRYTYTLNKPTKYSDPAGMQPIAAGNYDAVMERISSWVGAGQSGGDVAEFAYSMNENAQAMLDDYEEAAANTQSSSQSEADAPTGGEPQQRPIQFDAAQLMGEDEKVLREAPFKAMPSSGKPTYDTATLIVDDSRAGNVNNGDAFTVRVTFTLPEYAKSVTSGLSFVKLPADNRFGFYKPPKKDEAYEFHSNRRSAYVDIHLLQVNKEATNSYLTISIRGYYGSGDPFSGEARVELKSKADLPPPRFPRIPY